MSGSIGGGSLDSGVGRQRAPEDEVSTTPTSTEIKDAESHVVGSTTAPIVPTNDTFQAKNATEARDDNRIGATQTPQLPPDQRIEPETPANAQSLADNLDSALGAALRGSDGQPRDIKDLSMDEMARAFRLLEINNPDDKQATKEDLINIHTLSKRQALIAVDAEIKNAEQKMKEAEKGAAMYSAIGWALCIVNPLNLINKLGGDNQTTQIIGGILDLPGMLVKMLGEDAQKAKAEEGRTEFEAAQERKGKIIDAFATNGPVAAKKMEEEQFNQYLEQLEGLKTGPDGVPLKGLAKQLKPKLEGVLQAIQQMSETQGTAAAFEAAPQMFKDAILPVLVENNIPDADAKATDLAAAMTANLASLQDGKIPDEAMGVVTSLLGEQFDPESKDQSGSSMDRWAAAQRDANQTVSDWADETAATTSSRKLSQISL